jgi:hypothetical protein
LELYTQEFLKIKYNTLIDKIDRRLSKIPRFSGLKIFSHGIQSMARLTAKEYRDLMKIMIFVIDNLYQEDIQNIKNKELTTFYEEWNEMYIISRYEEFSESDLIKFKVKVLIIFKNLRIFLKTFTYF